MGSRQIARSIRLRHVPRAAVQTLVYGPFVREGLEAENARLRDLESASSGLLAEEQAEQLKKLVELVKLLCRQG